MTFKLEIECDNDAFQKNTLELRRLLSEIAALPGKKLTDFDGYRVRDVNGNTVGKVSVTQ